MIPTMILFGLFLGRWWRPALAFAAVGWPALLVAVGVMGWEVGLLSAALLAMVNTLVGVLTHQGILWIVRHVRGPAGLTHPSL